MFQGLRSVQHHLLFDGVVEEGRVPFDTVVDQFKQLVLEVLIERAEVANQLRGKGQVPV
jgi:hypothetical protein